MPTALPTTSPPTTVPTGWGCYPRELLLEYDEAVVTINNLGGRGSNGNNDPPVMRIHDVAPYESEKLDMIISVVDGFTYTPRDYSQTGVSSDGFVVINIKVGTEVMLRFQLVDSETSQPKRWPAFTFTVVDLDEGSTTREFFCVDHEQCDHRFAAPKGSQVNMDHFNGTCVGGEEDPHSQKEHRTTARRYESFMRGYGCDNVS